MDRSSELRKLTAIVDKNKVVKSKTKISPFFSRTTNRYLGVISPRLQVQALILNARFSLQRMLVEEQEMGTLFHFAPVVLAMGITTYFLSASEPLLVIILLTSLVAAVVALRASFHGALWLTACAIALFFGGLTVGKIRTDLVDTHPLVVQKTTIISGTIIEISRNQRSAPRYLIKTTMIEGVEKKDLPTLIRLSAASKHRKANPGDTITGLARLGAISGPAYPGSFDFSFNAWYNGMGASGFFMGKPEVKPASASDDQISWGMSAQIGVNQLRTKLAHRIRKALPNESGDVAVALIIGDRTGISRDTRESLRSSGLAHVLAISGMHMALVSLTMVWAVRFLLALSQRLALTTPVKNWAVGAGFVTATSYLMISGMSLATQRAWIMISIMILAAVVNRKPITLRSVAIAALAIMLVQPEAILSPGFQMSFAAVTAIVAAYEWLDERKRKKPAGKPNNTILRFFGTLIFTSLIAGLATSLFAAYHFHRIAPMGVLTNLMAMPLVSIIVMPMALLSVILMPYGLEQIALVPMGFGIEKVVEISSFVNSLGGNGVTGQLGYSVLPMAFIGLFLLTMLKTKLRISGFVILLGTTLFWQGTPVPDILLSEDGRAIAIKTSGNKLALMYPRRNKFVRDIWLRAFSGDQPGKLNVAGNEDETSPICGKDMCIAKTKQGAKVIVVYNPKMLEDACREADILLAPRLRWVNCHERQPQLVIKRGQLEEFGAHSIYLKANSTYDPSVAQLEENDAENNKNGTAKRKVEPLQLENILNSPIAENGDRPLVIINPDGDIENEINSTKLAETDKRKFKAVVAKVETAINNTARPWNRHRAGRAAYRQD